MIIVSYLWDGTKLSVLNDANEELMGNYLWGRGMAELGIPLITARIGAHYNNIFNGRKQTTPAYDFGKGTYGSPGFWDSPGDQRAISNGHRNSCAGKKLRQIRLKMNEFLVYNLH